DDRKQAERIASHVFVPETLSVARHAGASANADQFDEVFSGPFSSPFSSPFSGLINGEINALRLRADFGQSGAVFGMSKKRRGADQSVFRQDHAVRVLQTLFGLEACGVDRVVQFDLRVIGVIVSVIGKHLDFETAIRFGDQLFNRAVERAQKRLQRLLAAQMGQRIGLADVGDEEWRVRFPESLAKRGKVEMRDGDRSKGRGDISQRSFESRGVIIEGLAESPSNEFAAVQTVLNRSEQPILLSVVVMILVTRR